MTSHSYNGGSARHMRKRRTVSTVHGPRPGFGGIKGCGVSRSPVKPARNPGGGWDVADVKPATAWPSEFLPTDTTGAARGRASLPEREPTTYRSGGDLLPTTRIERGRIYNGMSVGEASVHRQAATLRRMFWWGIVTVAVVLGGGRLFGMWLWDALNF